MKIVLAGPPSSGKSVIVGAGYAATQRGNGPLVLKATMTDGFRLRSLARSTHTAPTRSRRLFRLTYRRNDRDIDIVEVIDYPGRAVRSANRAVTSRLLQDLDEADVVLAVQDAGQDDTGEPFGWASWAAVLRASLARRPSAPAVLAVQTQFQTDRPYAGRATGLLDGAAALPGMTGATVVIGRDQADLPLLWAIANGDGAAWELTATARKAFAKAASPSSAAPVKPLPPASPAPGQGGRRKKGPAVPDRLRVTVTMLGTPGSGKTTFMVAMVGTLAHGINIEGAKDVYALTYGGDPLKGHDDFSVLLEDWNALRQDGMLPPPTDNNPKSYNLVFCRGIEPLLDIDWIDYRGAVITGRAAESDVADMIDRVAASDCIYLVLDAQFLADGVSETNQLPIENSTRAEALSAIMLQAIQRRLSQKQPATSLVVLVTKADLLETTGDATGAQRQQIRQRLVDDVAKLLPIAFVEGVTAMIAPVSVGQFGSAAQGEVQPELVSPRGLHYPLLFTVLAGRWQQADHYGGIARDHEQIRDNVRRKQQELRGARRLVRGPILSLEIARKNKEALANRNREQQYAAWADELVDELRNRLIFRDGKRVQ